MQEDCILAIAKQREIARAWVIGCALLVASAWASGVSAQDCPGAEAAALAWLAKMSESAQQQSYRGVVALQRGGDLQVMQVSRRIGDGASFETLTQLTGQGAHVAREGHPLDCVHPGHQLLALGADLEAGQCDITRYYHFSVADYERVAGRKAVRIRIRPQDMLRYGYLLSLDTETGLPLKTVVFGGNGVPLERYQFANVSYNGNATLSEAAAATPDAQGAHTRHSANHPDPHSVNTDAQVSRPWKITMLPAGFVATDAAAGRAGRRSFTDGLAVFSVFVEEVERALPAGEGVVRSGSTTSYTQGLTVSGQTLLVTVIGEVPVSTARLVADSIRWVQ